MKNPLEQHVGWPVLLAWQLFSPEVTSLNAPVFAYRVGLMNPTEDIPWLARAVLIRVSIAASTGVEAEVPNKPVTLPARTIW